MADVLTEAQELFKESLGAQLEQRRQLIEDLEFSDPSKPRQWDEEIRRQRENDPGGKRPCLEHDQIGQYVANVAGQVEKQPPSLHAIPVGGGADKKAAEQIDGRFRHIEHASRAMQHYARAMTSAARLGVGYLTIRPEYTDRALGWQEPRIGSEPDPLNVVFDPWSTDTDGADATFGYILSPLSSKEFERRWPGKEARSFGDTEAPRLDARQSIVVAEQWYQEQKNRNMIVHSGPDGEEAVLPEEDYHAARKSGQDLPFLRNFSEKYQCVKWRRMSGCDVLEASEYPADSIGIIPVYGYVSFADGRMTYCGIPRRGRSGQQAYNYHVSEQQAYIAQAPKSPWWVSKRASAGVEHLLDRMSVDSRAWMPFNDNDTDGAIALPTRISPTIGLGNHEAGAEQALHDIQASIGMYQANLGAQSNETSGVAIESRKQQGEASTAHFPSHLAASLGQLGRVVMQMDSRLLDKRRTVPTIGFDESPGQMTVDPDQQEAFKRGPDGVSINPRVGTYGVRVVVGASYSTQRSQTNAAFAEIMRGNPDMATTVAPFWAQTLDIPGSDKFAQALATLAPPAVQAILKPEGKEDTPDPAQMAAQLKQLQDAIKEATDLAHQAEQAESDAVEALHKAQLQLADKDRDGDIRAYEAETNRLKITGANDDQIQAIVRDLVTSMMAQPTPEDEPEGAGEQPQEQPQDWQSQLHIPQPAEPMQEAQQEAPQEADEPQPEAMEPQGLQEPEPEPQEPIQPPEPPPPSPEMIALMQGQAQLADSQSQVAQALIALVEMSGKPRKKVPVRDKAGNLLHVIESVGD